MRRLLALLAIASCTAAQQPDELRVSALLTPTFVQVAYSNPGNVTTASKAFTASETAGDLNVVFVAWFNATTTLTSIADNRGNTYQLAVGPTIRSGTSTQSMYYAKNIAGGATTVTVQFSSTAPSLDLRIIEYKNIDTVSPLDVATGTTGSSTSAATGTFTTHAANEMIVASDYNGTTTTGAGPGYTLRVQTSPDHDVVEDMLAATAGNYTATAPLNTTTWWIMQAAAFKAAADPTDGGADSAGGASGTGGGAGVGGSSGTGGTSGTSGTGGSSGSGGTAGVVGTGGTSGSSGTGGSAGSSGTGGSGGTGGTGGAFIPATFPLVYSADHRYLQDQTGAPFPITGRASWSIITLSAADRATYLDDTVAHGFDAIEMGVIWRHPNTNTVPFAGNGTAPFLKQLNGGNWDGHLNYTNINSDGPDMTTPNPTYWSFVDTFLADCASRGIVILMFPSYVGYPGTGQGWMDEMVANGPTKVMTYGNFVSDRYKNQPNIVWMAAGDQGNNDQPFNTAQQTAEWGLLTGVNAVPGRQSALWSAEWRRGSIGTDQTVFGSLMSLNSIYVFDYDVVTQGRRAYGFAPAFPSFLLEEPYDNSGTPQPVRRFEWWAWLTTIGGYVAGDENLWPMNPGWQSQLGSQANQDYARLNAFMRSITWYQLVPSGLNGMKTLCTAGCGTTTDVVAASATPSGSLLVAYIPPDHSGNVTIDMTVLSGSTLARWFNPVSAAYTTIGTFPNIGTHVFAPPGDNGSGFDDWVLVLSN